MFTSNNPVFSRDVFRMHAREAHAAMTVRGTVMKAILLLALVLAGAFWVWTRMGIFGPASVQPYLYGGAFAGFLCVVLTTMNPHWSPISAPIYALLEGFTLGALTSVMELRYPGIAIQAAQLTLATLGGMLVLYRTGMIVVTNRMRSMMLSVLMGLCLFSVLRMIMSFFGIHILLGSSLMSIGFSGAVCVLAAFFLLLDFEQILQGERSCSPKYMEWYSAFGLLVTLVWLYVEVLRLLAKLQDRRR